MKRSIRDCSSSRADPACSSNLFRRPLVRREELATRSLIRRVLEEVPADLLEAALFGSRARGTARPDSDIDILLIFERLPDDREPHAGIAEGIARDIGAAFSVPLNVWTVSREDARPGCRTPMLVDALDDAITLWCASAPMPRITFEPEDALYCAAALQRRVLEGSREFQERLRRGDRSGAIQRGRDDIVRLCTALLLLNGVTRPRRAEAVRQAAALLARDLARSPRIDRVLEWAAASFGRCGEDSERVPGPPVGGTADLIAAIDWLHNIVGHEEAGLSHRMRGSQHKR